MGIGAAFDPNSCMAQVDIDHSARCCLCRRDRPGFLLTAAVILTGNNAVDFFSSNQPARYCRRQ
jgi:hypothetical protein